MYVPLFVAISCSDLMVVTYSQSAAASHIRISGLILYTDLVQISQLITAYTQHEIRALTREAREVILQWFADEWRLPPPSCTREQNPQPWEEGLDRTLDLRDLLEVVRRICNIRHASRECHERMDRVVES